MFSSERALECVCANGISVRRESTKRAQAALTGPKRRLNAKLSEVHFLSEPDRERGGGGRNPRLNSPGMVSLAGVYF